MNYSNNSGVGRILAFGFLGLILGGILGESMGMLLGQIGEMLEIGTDNIVRNTFIHAFEFGFGMDPAQPIVVDLYMIKFTLGLSFKFNVMSVLGLGISFYIMKWSGQR